MIMAMVAASVRVPGHQFFLQHTELCTESGAGAFSAGGYSGDSKTGEHIYKFLLFSDPPQGMGQFLFEIRK